MSMRDEDRVQFSRSVELHPLGNPPDVPDPATQERVCEQAGAVQLNEDGAVSEPGDAERTNIGLRVVHGSTRSNLTEPRESSSRSNEAGARSSAQSRARLGVGAPAAWDLGVHRRPYSEP
jgi:hypothetical protein